MSSASPPDDLLHALVYLSAHYGRAKSAEAVKAGLAIDASGMGPSLFIEAAERIGLRAKVTSQKLKDIDVATLPLTLVMKDGRAFVLLEKNPESLVIFDPKENRKKQVKSGDIQKHYSGKLILTAPMKKGQNTRGGHWFWQPFWKNAAIYRDVLIAAILVNLFGLASPLFIMNVYDRVIPQNAVETGWVLGGAALVIFVFDFIIRSLRGYFIDFAGRKIDVTATRQIYDQILDMKLSDRPRSSGATANMLKDFDAVRDFMTSATIAGLVDLPFTLFFLFVIYLIGGPIALLLLGLIVLVLMVGLVLQIPLRRFVRASMKSAEAKHGLLVETIHGLETIKAIGADGGFRARYGAEVSENALWGQKSRFYSAISGNFASWAQQSASILIVLMGMYMVKDHALSMGGLIACVILSGRAMTPVAQMANLITRYHQAKSAMQTIDKLMAKKVDRPPEVNFLHRPDLKGKITFDKVSFEYPQTARKVLDGVSFIIQPGEKVGLIGRIGSGKSTIARLLMDLYDPTDGTILYDDTDERQIDPADLRRHIGYISQDVVLFSGTVRENIVAGCPRATEEDILEVAKKAGVHDFISKHPSGYDALIGERGEGLSGGQRQAIALARAMLLKPSIYVCDEPTNAMDVQAENAFQQHMATEAKDKTLILITHRQPLLAMVDRLILMEQGCVVLDGKRDDVIKALASGNMEIKNA